MLNKSTLFTEVYYVFIPQTILSATQVSSA